MESIKKLFSRDQHKYTRLEQEEHKKELKRVEYSYAITHTWRIPNFSSIINTELYLFSDVFAGGFHKWIMIIYPKGEKKDDQVSIFLRVADSGMLPIGWTRDVKFSLSIINEIDEYTVTHGAQTIFAEARTSWGFQGFMALDKLRRTDHPFLVKDTITVRAEVRFNKEQEKETPRIKEVHLSDEKIGDAQTICRKCREYDRLTEGNLVTLTIIKKVNEKEFKRVENSYAIKYTWRIPNFSRINTDYLLSNVFAVGEHKWHLQIYPKGSEKDGNFSIYLCATHPTTLPEGWTRDVAYRLSVISEIDEYTAEKETKHIFDERSIGWGYASFMTLDKLHDIDRRFLVEGTITVRAEVWFNKEQEKETSRIKEVHLSDEKIGDAQTICRKCHEYDRLTEEKVNKKEFKRVENSYAIKHTWRIPNFSRINTDYLLSNVFAGGEHKWHLQIYPKGSKKDGNFSIYLCATHPATLPKGWTRDVAYRLSVISEIDEYTVEKETEHIFEGRSNGWGYQSFMTLDKLRDIDQRFLVDDTITVRAEVGKLLRIIDSSTIQASHLRRKAYIFIFRFPLLSFL